MLHQMRVVWNHLSLIHATLYRSGRLNEPLLTSFQPVNFNLSCNLENGIYCVLKEIIPKWGSRGRNWKKEVPTRCILLQQSCPRFPGNTSIFSLVGLKNNTKYKRNYLLLEDFLCSLTRILRSQIIILSSVYGTLVFSTPKPSTSDTKITLYHPRFINKYDQKGHEINPFKTIKYIYRVQSQRCSHRLGCKCIECWLYQACMYDLERMGSILEIIGDPSLKTNMSSPVRLLNGRCIEKKHKDSIKNNNYRTINCEKTFSTVCSGHTTAPAKLPSKLHLFAFVDFLEQSLCSGSDTKSFVGLSACQLQAFEHFLQKDDFLHFLLNIKRTVTVYRKICRRNKHINIYINLTH
ncbi:hypothetical protein VP01_2673g1 [Puccinia sorghi]|uniref:Uncharacterized protein n=1 Tax=Puccinia sorghi TaxID=27349 RepID=A0A0L6V3Z9_9BASI|nr:hypothetical protein VP01_2673g1 [Puccinia sorghi]